MEFWEFWWTVFAVITGIAVWSLGKLFSESLPFWWLRIRGEMSADEAERIRRKLRGAGQ